MDQAGNPFDEGPLIAGFLIGVIQWAVTVKSIPPPISVLPRDFRLADCPLNRFKQIKELKINQVAESGAQPGNNNAAKGKRWRDAIEHCAECWPNPPDTENCLPNLRGLRIAAYAFVKKMIEENDIAFFREFGDRIDGKAHQSIDQTTQHSGEIVNKITLVAMS